MASQSISREALAMVVAVLIIAAGALALASFQATTTANTAAFNVTGNGLTGLQNASSFFGTIGTIVAVVGLIGLVVIGFSRLGQRSA